MVFCLKCNDSCAVPNFVDLKLALGTSQLHMIYLKYLIFYKLSVLQL